MSQSEDRSSRELSSPPRCKELLSSDVIISTMSPNTIVMKRDIEISQSIAHPLSQLRKEISLLLVNADLSPKPSTSTFSRSSPTKLSVTSESNSCSFDLMTPYYLSYYFYLMHISSKRAEYK